MDEDYSGTESFIFLKSSWRVYASYIMRYIKLLVFVVVIIIIITVSLLLLFLICYDSNWSVLSTKGSL